MKKCGTCKREPKLDEAEGSWIWVTMPSNYLMKHCDYILAGDTLSFCSLLCLAEAANMWHAASHKLEHKAIQKAKGLLGSAVAS